MKSYPLVLAALFCCQTHAGETSGGHTWPGDWQSLQEFVAGKTSGELDANTAIWDFFMKH